VNTFKDFGASAGLAASASALVAYTSTAFSLMVHPFRKVVGGDVPRVVKP
jgi:hypothetical protein